MAKLWTAAALVGVLLAQASSGFAQDATEAPPPLPSHSLPAEIVGLTPEVPAFLFSAGDDLSELQRWVDAYTDWQAWASRWRGQREPGWLTGYRERRPEPPPPSWLGARCSAMPDDEAEPLATACELYTLWSSADLDPPALRTATVLAGTQERAPHITWWEHLHMDLMWPDLQLGSSTYGVVGMHHATTVKGRWQVFTAPGALLLNLPSYHGTRTWKVAVNYGVGFRLFEFAMFGSRPAELHFNLAKAWVVSDTTDAAIGRTIDLVGFSLSFKKRDP